MFHVSFTHGVQDGAPQNSESQDAFFDKGTMMVLGRVAPFMVAACLVYSRRTHGFHVLHVKRAIRRPMARHLAFYSKRGSEPETGIPNPVLERWFQGMLDGSPQQQHRVVNVIAGDALLGKSSTTLRYAAKTGRCGLYFDFFAAHGPKDVKTVMTRQLTAQNGPLARLVTPLHMDFRVALPEAVRSIFMSSRNVEARRPLIIVNHLDKVFNEDKDGSDSTWLLSVLVAAARHCDVVALCSDEAAIQHLLPNQVLVPYISLMFCPEPPHAVLASLYSGRLPEDLPAEQRSRLGARMSQLFRRAPELCNDMLRAMARGHSPGFAAQLVIDQKAVAVAESLRLGRPTTQLTAEVAEETLLLVECALLFALSATNHLVRQAGVQRFDPAPRRLMELGYLRVETGRDGTRRLRVAQPAAIIVALSEKAPRAVAALHAAELRRCTTGDVERLKRLADGAEFLLAHCQNARKKLSKWMSLHMDGLGPDQAISWQTTLPRFNYPTDVRPLSDEGSGASIDLPLQQL